MFHFLFLSICRFRSGLIDSIFKSIVVISLQIVLHESVEGDGEASVEDPDEHNTQVEDPELYTIEFQNVLHVSVEGDGVAIVEDPDDHNSQVQDP